MPENTTFIAIIVSQWQTLWKVVREKWLWGNSKNFTRLFDSIQVLSIHYTLQLIWRPCSALLTTVQWFHFFFMWMNNTKTISACKGTCQGLKQTARHGMCHTELLPKHQSWKRINYNYSKRLPYQTSKVQVTRMIQLKPENKMPEFASLVDNLDLYYTNDTK